MRSALLSLTISLFIATLATPALRTTPVSAAGSRPRPAPTPQSNVQMSQEELQEAVISYANRFIATIGQAAFQLEEKIPTKQGRLIAASRKVYSISSAAEIAAGPNAGPALLDLVVMTTLNRLVWEFYWRPQVFGMPASIMVDAFKKMEADAWGLAAKVMTSQQLDELFDVIVDWHSHHPDQVAVDYIRFSDFGDLGKKPNLKQIQKPGGLLAPVREATAAVDEVRMTSERAMFLLTKMQLIIGFQAELVYKQLVMQPEMESLFEDISGFRTTADRFADLLEQLPNRVADERSAMFTDAERLIAGERTAVLRAFDDKATVIHQINKSVQETLNRLDTTFESLRKTTADAERLIQGAQHTTREMKDLLAAVDGLAARFVPNDPATPFKPFDINEYTALLVKVQETVDSLNQLTRSFNETGTPLITNILEAFNDAADQRVDHIFWRLFQLLAATGVIILLLLVVSQRQKQTKK